MEAFIKWSLFLVANTVFNFLLMRLIFLNKASFILQVFPMNLTFKSRDELCETAYRLKSEKILFSVVFSQTILSGFTILFLYLCFKSKQIRHVYSIINNDLKVSDLDSILTCAF